MKILNIAFFALLLSFVGCTKKEEVTLNKKDAISVGKLQSELIIGSWQLSSIGTISQTASSGCGSSGSSHEETSWKATSLKQNILFKPSGDFLKSTANDAVCAGTYKVESSAILMKTGCSPDEEKHIINAIDASSMIIVEDKTFYRYDKQ
jgi:hypothetical protein